MAKQIPDRNRMESLRKELGFKDPGIFEKIASRLSGTNI